MPFSPQVKLLLSRIHEKILKKEECKHKKELLNILEAFINETALQKAIHYLHKLCNMKDSDALFLMGIALQNHIGFSKNNSIINHKKAILFFKKAVELNHPLAKFQLGIYAEHRIVGKKNAKLAFELYKAVYESGEIITAGYALANCYIKGIGVAKSDSCAEEIIMVAKKYIQDEYFGQENQNLKSNQDVAKHSVKCAIKLAEVAALYGHADAALNMASYYEKGIIIEKDLKLAIGYALSSAQKHSKSAYIFLRELSIAKQSEAVHALGICAKEGFCVKKNYPLAIERFMMAAKLDWKPAYVELANLYNEDPNSSLHKKECFDLYKKNENDKESLYQLGLHHEQQKTFSEYCKAYYYYNQSGLQGCEKAFYKLGHFCQEGLGVYKNEKKAVEWYKLAAEKGHIEAQRTLATCFAEGVGIPSNIHVAIFYYNCAAFQEDVDSQFLLAILWIEGQYCKPNLEKALIHLGKVINNVNSEHYAKAHYAVGLHYENLLKDTKKAFEYYKIAAEKGLGIAQYKLGKFYYHGEIVQVDLKKSCNYFLKSAKTNCSQAQYWVSKMLFEGRGCNINFDAALEYLKKAADQDNEEAQCSLAVRYEFGICVKINIEKAVEYYTSASESGNIVAHYALSLLYRDGKGVSQDRLRYTNFFKKALENIEIEAKIAANEVAIHKAFKLYTLSAEHDHMPAHYTLAGFYEEGRGTDKNIELAALHYFKAAIYNNKDALEKLITLTQQYPGKSHYYLRKYYLIYDIEKAIDFLYDAILADEKEAVETLSCLAEKHCPKAQFVWGRFLVEGSKIVPTNIERGITWLTIAAKSGCISAAAYLGRVYSHNNIVQNKPNLMLDYLYQAAMGSDINSILHLGKIYADGYVLSRDLTMAHKYYSMAANLGNVKAMIWLDDYNKQKLPAQLLTKKKVGLLPIIKLIQKDFKVKKEALKAVSDVKNKTKLDSKVLVDTTKNNVVDPMIVQTSQFLNTQPILMLSPQSITIPKSIQTEKKVVEENIGHKENIEILNISKGQQIQR